MTDTESMAVGETSDHLAQDANGFGFREAAIGDDVVEELAALNVL